VLSHVICAKTSDAKQANRLAQEKQLTAEMLTTIELADLAV
jgi:hypothetical protein